MNNDEFLKLIQDNLDDGDKKIDADDKNKIKYVLYARKSTEGEERQEKSIEHQIQDCREKVVEKYGIKLNPEDIFVEKKSAKISGQRPVFKEMMKLIKKGKYNGIIAWHYDRLARNMKEAGEIIDLVDNGKIADLLFATANFENTPNGKMVLGISFVLSKHYSDHLSESVLRGTNKRTEQGVVLRKFIHGYKITKTGKIYKDDRNWEIIHKAFRMRVDERATEVNIAKYINSTGYQVYCRGKEESGYRNFKFTKQTVSKLLDTSLYAGVYSYGGIAIPTAKCCLDEEFEPMLTPDEFVQINPKNVLHSGIRHRVARSSVRDKSDFLRQFVICKHCGRTMNTTVVNPNRKDGGRFYFRCDTTDCPMRGKNLAGSVVRDYIIDYLEKHTFASEKNYEKYLKDRERGIEKDIENLKAEKKNLARETTKKKNAYDNARKNLSSYGEHIDKDFLDKLKTDWEESKKSLEDKEYELEMLENAPMALKDFLELYENIGVILRSTTSMGLSDEIIKIFFSNIAVEAVEVDQKSGKKQWSIVDHKLREPFDKLLTNADCQTWSG